jgi:hypothetical protein
MARAKDRTIYLTETAIHVLQSTTCEEGSGDYVFLYRNAPLKKDIIREQLKSAGNE